jgi:phosphomannomutase
LRRLQRLCDAEFDLTDGLKAVWPDRRLSARASNTEPIIRMTAEAPTESDARALMHSALECLSHSA